MDHYLPSGSGSTVMFCVILSKRMVATAPPAKCIVYQAKKKIKIVETSFFKNRDGYFLTRLKSGPPPRNSRMQTQNPASGAGRIFELMKLKEFIDNIVDWSRTMDS